MTLYENVSVDRAINDIISLGSPNPLNDIEIIVDNIVGIEVKKFDGKIYFQHIRSFDKGKGSASKVLDKVLSIADKHGVSIVLTPVKTDEGGLSNAQLKQWYMRRGFKKYRSYGLLIREPNENLEIS